MEGPPPLTARCLGVDPGLRNMGWAVVEATTAANTPPKVLSSGKFDCGRRKHPSRLVMAAASDACARLASEHGRQLDAVAVEEQSCMARRSPRVYAAAAGTSMTLRALVPWARVYDLSPVVWKRRVGIPSRGKHRLNKKAAVEEVKSLFGIVPEDDHQADAMLLALAGAKEHVAQMPRTILTRSLVFPEEEPPPPLVCIGPSCKGCLPNYGCQGTLTDTD